MGKRRSMCLMALAGVAAGYLLHGYGVSAQQAPAESRFAAVPGERGGQDIGAPTSPEIACDVGEPWRNRAA